MTNTIKKTYFNWSSGKDAALALYYLQKQKDISVEKLLTTANEVYQRVSMHGVRIDLIQQQSESLGIPLDMVHLPQAPTMQEYEAIFSKEVKQLQSEGFTHSAFGDIFLEDLRVYREQQLQTLGVQALFPLWKKSTKELMKEFIRLGFKAIVVCIKSSKLDPSFLGRELDESFIEDLPDDVDLCGENGEYHTFCYDGPIFKQAISFKKGERTFREYEIKTNDCQLSQNETSFGFWFLDLIPEG